MPLSQRWKTRLKATALAMGQQGPKRGDDIFAGGYPSSWDAYVGQGQAKEYLQAAVAAAEATGDRLPHVLLRSGHAGIGKSTLPRLIAGQLGVGLLELSGKIKIGDARTALRSCEDRDVVFIDEIHQTAGVAGEWLLHLLQDGRLVTGRGTEQMPNVTVIGATTDAQKLPLTILSRFKIRPTLAPYTDEEAVLIAASLARRMGFGTRKMPMPPPGDLKALAMAGNNSPRDIESLLTAYSTTAYSGGTSVERALQWAQVTWDGLDDIAQMYLKVLVECEGTASEATIKALLNEPGPLRHTEQLLRQREYLEITSAGRRLTEQGLLRARQLILEDAQ
jgi:Holliday junction resolvasome RuvABC ATP-dependent DNA helicase subunit